MNVWIEIYFHGNQYHDILNNYQVSSSFVIIKLLFQQLFWLLISNSAILFYINYTLIKIFTIKVDKRKILLCPLKIILKAFTVLSCSSQYS